MHLIDVAKQLGTDEQCLAFLEAMRWPDGVRCTTCGAKEVSVITRKAQSKNKRGTLYQCLEKSCKLQFSTTSGTIFADSHLPLNKWFLAVALIVDAKKGMSAKQVQAHLNLKSYQTAWYLNHRIRKAMEETGSPLLTGTVEIDETYIGGKPRKGIIRKTRSEKDVVIGMRERGGKLRLFHTPDAKAATVKNLVRKHISNDVEVIVTDESVIYPIAFDGHCASKHQTVQHKREYVRADDRNIHTNTIESAFSLLKRGLIGSFHQVSIKHLHRYLSEFEFRFNNRQDESLFTRTIQRMAGTGTMPYKQLTAKV
jgi:transposase-like protein